jgi:hypothetical protein
MEAVVPVVVVQNLAAFNKSIVCSIEVVEKFHGPEGC